MLTHSIYERDARVRRYAECLAREGGLVDIVCLASDGIEADSHPENIRVYPIPKTRKRSEGVSHLLEWLISAVWMFIRVSRLDLRVRYDLIHIHNMPDFLVFCALVPRLRGCPVILNVHDPVPEITISKLGLTDEHPIVKIQVFLEKIAVMFSTHVVTATDTFKRILVQRGISPDKITVVTNSAYTGIFKPDAGYHVAPLERKFFTLLYVGTVAERYGLDVCVRSLPLLRSEIPEIRLRIVPKIRNEGAALTRSLELARELGVADIVRLDDPVPLEQIGAIMQDADIGVYPAYRDRHMDLALSLKIPEMAALGLCIVATRLSVLEDLYGDESIAFVPSGDHQALARKILELYRSPDTRERLVRNARERTDLFSWDREYQTYRALIESLVK